MNTPRRNPEGEEAGKPINAYDAVTYPSHPYRDTHPDHLHALARLARLRPVAPDRARILEIGCASGGNLIPIAQQCPGAECIGVDLSDRQIADGQQRIDALGLDNIQLRPMNLCDLDPSFGHFDYVLCHGVFSWVPATVQSRILEICRDHLSPTGVAYISYNANPGWFMRGMLRDMMLYHIRDVSQPERRAARARELLQFLVEGTDGQNDPYSLFLRQESALLSRQPDAYLFHDHLEEHNQPMFYFQFIERLQQHRLQFLTETNPADMFKSNLPPQAARKLASLTNDVHQRNQYADFISNRMFHRSVICHADRKPRRKISEQALDGLRVAGRFERSDGRSEAITDPTGELTVRSGTGVTIKTSDPGTKAILGALNAAYPATRTTRELLAMIREQIPCGALSGKHGQLDWERFIGIEILRLLSQGALEFRYLPDRFSTSVSERPVASPLARLQAQEQALVTTARHALYRCPPFVQALLPMVDGTRTREDIGRWIGEQSQQGHITLNVVGTIPEDKDSLHQTAADQALAELARAGLLVG